MSSVRVEIEAAPELSLAMVENAVPLVARLALTNDGAERLDDLTVELALLPDFSAKWSAHVSAIPPGGTFHLDDIELPLDRGKLVNQLERGRADLAIWVRAKAHALPISNATRPIDILAYNEWSRATVPQLLAAFVLPRDFAFPHVHRREPLNHPDPRPGITAERVLTPEALAAVKSERVKDAYEWARTYPAIFDGIACACSCGGDHGNHRSLLVCFETAQATGCQACRDQAQFVARLAKKDTPLEQIRAEVDKKFG